MKVLFKIFFIIFVFNVSLKALHNKNSNLLTDIIVIQDDSLSSSGLIIQDASGFGYHINTVHPDSVTPELLNLHRLVILSTGNNSEGCSNYDMRLSVQTFIDNGGKVIVEGGDNTYLAFVVHHYPAFSNKVLKTSGFTTHNGGNLNIESSHITTNLFTSPNFLPNTIGINFIRNSDMDVCSSSLFAEVFYKTSLYNDKAGIIVAPSVNDPQIINFCFNYAAIGSRSDAKNLLNNSIFNLIGYPVFISNISTEIPVDLKLQQNYPNPFNPSTIIEFSIPKYDLISLKIYDMLGKEIAVLINENLSPGKYRLNFTGSALKSGFYFYTLNSGNRSETKKMVILK